MEPRSGCVAICAASKQICRLGTLSQSETPPEASRPTWCVVTLPETSFDCGFHRVFRCPSVYEMSSSRITRPCGCERDCASTLCTNETKSRRVSKCQEPRRMIEAAAKDRCYESTTGCAMEAISPVVRTAGGLMLKSTSGSMFTGRRFCFSPCILCRHRQITAVLSTNRTGLRK